MIVVSRNFGSDNSNWSPFDTNNRLYLRGVFIHLNRMLEHRGFVLLNDVFDILGMSRTTKGATAGWLREDKEVRIKFFRNPDHSYQIQFTCHEQVADQIDTIQGA